MKKLSEDDILIDNNIVLYPNSATPKTRKNQTQSDFLREKLLNKPNIGDALLLIGDNHQYQYRLLIIFCLQWFVLNCLLLIPAFIYLPPKFLCNGVECTEDSGGCDQQILAPSRHVTITSEFRLFCERKYLRTLGQSITYFGSLVGMLVIAMLSDNLGRKPAITVAYLLITVGCFGMAFSPNETVLILFSFICGMGIFPSVILQFVVLGEQAGAKFRQRGSLVILVVASIWEMALVMLVYLIDNWRDVILYAIAIPVLVVNFQYFLYFESPKFLSIHKKKQAVETLDRIAKINKKKPLPENFINKFTEMSEIEAEEKKHGRIYTYYDLFRYKSLRMRTICVALLLCTIQICYFGSEFALHDIGGNVYMNAIFMAVAEFFGYLLPSFTITMIPRRKACFTSITLTTIICITFLFLKIPEDCKPEKQQCIQKNLQVIFACLSRFFNIIIYAMIFVYFPELFPTCVRSLGMGIAKVVGIIGVILSPTFVELAPKLHVNAMVVIGAFSFIGVLPSYLLPETLGKKIPDEISEVLYIRSIRETILSSKKASIHETVVD